MENACKEFLKLLSEAEREGASVAVVELAKKLSRIPPDATPHDIFQTCKEKGWVMGSATGPWLTPQGRHHAAAG